MSAPDLQPRDDAELFALARTGDEAAFASIAERHGPSLLSFCRHMLGSRQDAEDALQHVLLDAFRALRRGDAPSQPRAWLFAIARNRCTSMLRARRPVVAVGDDLDHIATEGLSAEVERRDDLRQLLADLRRLPEDQRAALLLAELHDDSHADIAVALDVPTRKVKALVFQARTALIAERDARAVPCQEIQEQLATLRGSALRRSPLRRHVANCDGCRRYEAQLAAQRSGLAILLPVVPVVPLATLAAGAATTGGVAVGFGALLGGAGAKVAATALVIGVGAIGSVAVFDGARDGGDTGAAKRSGNPAAKAKATGTPSTEPIAVATRTATPAAKRTLTGRRAKRSQGPTIGGRQPTDDAPATPAAATPAPTVAAAPAATTAPGRSGASPGKSSSAPGRVKAPGTAATGRGQPTPAPTAAPTAAPGQGAAKGRAEAPGQAGKKP